LANKEDQKIAMVQTRKRKVSISLDDSSKPDASVRKRQKGEYHSIKDNYKYEALTFQELVESPKAVLTSAPDQRLDVFVFGTNCGGELGLGDATKKSELPGPVLNPKLSAETVGVVQLAVGGIHSAALTHDNRILTWGVNDEWTLGRDTTVESKKTPIDATSDNGEDDDEEDEDDEVDLNLKEATPLPVDSSHFADGTVFTQLVATDSATFALTSRGLVYGWGTFRVCCPSLFLFLFLFLFALKGDWSGQQRFNSLLSQLHNPTSTNPDT
jgi:regulator of chromosome condensation